MNRLALPQGRMLYATCSLFIAVVSPASQATNWLMVQGTEAPGAADFRSGGHLQPQYTYHSATPLSGLTGGAARFNGKVVAQNLAGPELTSQDQLTLRRAAFRMRGKAGETFNYFVQFEAGSNLLTYDPFGERARTVGLSELSMTWNGIPGARLRAGLFKNPGSEEVLQGLAAQNYTEFSDFQGRVNLERFSTGGARLGGSPQQAGMGDAVTSSYGSSVFRDWGIQLFDRFQNEQWDVGYALKLGRGDALFGSGQDNTRPELYLYGSAEYRLPGTAKAKGQGIKSYLWYQNGERRFASDIEQHRYTRVRYGFGVKALGEFIELGLKQRVQLEWMQADGMIFTSPAGGVAGFDLQYAAQSGNKARGGYLDFGLYLTPEWELGFRYDRNELLYATRGGVNPGNYRLIQGYTYALNYHFSPKLRMAFNYIDRSSDNPRRYQAGEGFTSTQADALTANVDKLVDNLGERLTLQLTWFY